MSPALASFMEELVLDPAKFREFRTSPDRLLAESGLTESQRRAIASREVLTITRELDGQQTRYAEGAAAAVVAVVIHASGD